MFTLAEHLLSLGYPSIPKAAMFCAHFFTPSRVQVHMSVAANPTHLPHKVMLMVSCLAVLPPPSSDGPSPTRGGGPERPLGGDGGSGGGM